ncbi:hypothetical protein [Photobacterium damselae]|uniref:hypothetical protein n=1 Tax=Photobacterium damselae TaxID=38293 RepID=UPI0013021482|nr:hypothetical protein [Photobacterium damselae]
MRYLFILLFPLIANAYTLDGSITGKSIKYRNLTDSISGKVVISWQPATKLLPAKKWSPGFKFLPATLKLSGPGGIVDVQDAIKVIGIEYKTSGSLERDDSQLISVATCEVSGDVGDVVYVTSTTSICQSSYSYDSSSQMPFYFTRPVIDIDESRIIEAFDSLDNKVEGYYNTTVPINFMYSFELDNGVKTWRNLTEQLVISFYYRPDNITDIQLEKPGVHQMDIIPSGDTNIKGNTQFNVIATGYFNDGIRLELAKSNDYTLSSGSSSYKIPYSIYCSRCEKKLLVDNGEIIGNGVSNILVSKSKSIRFPIDVTFDIRKDSVPVGNYVGQFSIIFSSDI